MLSMFILLGRFGMIDANAFLGRAQHQNATGAMSKNENGKLGAAAAGYVLHRVFVQRHGWFIRALEPAGKALAAWNTSTPVSILEERVPKHVQSLFESRLGERGLGL